MAIIISPSTKTTKAWGRFVNYPVRIDLVNFVWSFFVLLFALSAGITQTVGTGGGAGGAFYVLSNIAAPSLSLILSFAHVYFYSRRLLRRGYALGINIFMTIGWIAQVSYWVFIQVPYYLNEAGFETRFNFYFTTVPWAMCTPMLIGGLTLTSTTISYLVLASIALTKVKPSNASTKSVRSMDSREHVEVCAKSEQGNSRPSSLHANSIHVETTPAGSIRSEITNGQISQGRRSIFGRSINGRSLNSQSTHCHSYRSLPDYDDIISIGARAAAMEEIETNEKKPDIADTCYCGNCGASFASSSRSSFRS